MTMADETMHTLPADQNLDYHIVTLFQRLETMRKDQSSRGTLNISMVKTKQSMQAELLTLEFWRSISAECLASFLYVFIVCGAAAGAGVGASVSSVLLASALASGFAITTLTQCFSQVSGAHINPSVTIGMAIVRAISPLRAALYITAQCGGGIAGAALLYGVTVPGYQGNLQAAISDSSALGAWERLAVELILTFVVVLAYFMSIHSYKSFFGSSSLAIGAAYTACSFVSMPYLNPARSLGPAFVLHKWDNHWVYWVGPLGGGVLAGLVFEYLFNPKRNCKLSKTSMDTDSASLQSDVDIPFDLDMDNKPHGNGMQSSKYRGQTYRSNGGGPGANGNDSNGPSSHRDRSERDYCQQNMYSTAPHPKFEHNEPLYGGTRSMYCKSPPLTRANLNRSQSVYTKSQTAINRDFGGSRPGPLVPAQSLYPMRMPSSGNGQNSHLQNQNVQNQMQQRSESIYGIRGQIKAGERPPQPMQQHQLQQDSSGFQNVYGTRGNAVSIGDGLCNNKYDKDPREMRDDSINLKLHPSSVTTVVTRPPPQPHRPESMYGSTSVQRRGQSTQSDDSSYGSFQDHPTPSVTPPTRKPSGPLMHHPQNPIVEALCGGSTVGYSSQQQQIRFQGAPPERKTSSSGGSDRQVIYGTNTIKQQQQQQQQQQQPQLQQIHQQVPINVPGNATKLVNGGPASPMTHQYSLH